MKNHKHILKMVLSAFFLALAYVMPYLTGQIPEVGSMLCPMHIPVILCGFICGPAWGLAVGATAPIMRSLLTGGFPPMFPTAIAMAFELAAYGAVCGILHKILPKRKSFVYVSLLSAMIIGRLIWGLVTFICISASGGAFTFSAFLAGAVVNAIPGIIVQIVVIPVIVILLRKTKTVREL